MEWKKTSVETITETKVCTGETVVKVLTCTWAPPVELTTDLKVEMDAQIFYATDGSSLIKKNRSDQRFGAAEMKTCEEVQKVTKVDRRSTSDEKKIQEKSPEFLK